MYRHQEERMAVVAGNSDLRIKESFVMIYSDFHGEKLSRLGLGMMRLPTNADGTIDERRTAEMIDYAIKNGINYFDTAYQYHGGESERIAGRILSRYPRDSYNLASKFPGHAIAESYDVKGIFEEQLAKCRVDYFDFYLFHNVNETSIKVYTDPKWGIADYLKEQKRQGRIRHLGFSCHGLIDNLREFLTVCGDIVEFCQIQLNYLDWTLQGAKEKYELLKEYNIPVWVMEPVRGGKLASLNPEDTEALIALRPYEKIPAWAFRFIQGLDNVAVTLSGMSDMQQLKDNIETYSCEKPLDEKELAALFNVAEHMKRGAPCTACRYCCEVCPMGLNIPRLISAYNDFNYQPTFSVSMMIDSLPENKRPSACIGCGSCSAICPQKIDVPSVMHSFASSLEKFPSWAEESKKREIAQEKNRLAAARKRVNDFLKSAETYFLATVDENGEPRVRPFGTINLFEDRLYIQTGRKKDVFRQLMNNEHFELCAFKDGEWLRVSGRLLEDPRHEPGIAMLDAYPELKSIYNVDDGNSVVMYIKDGTATFSSFTKPEEKIRL